MMCECVYVPFSTTTRTCVTNSFTEADYVATACECFWMVYHDQGRMDDLNCDNTLRVKSLTTMAWCTMKRSSTIPPDAPAL